MQCSLIYYTHVKLLRFRDDLLREVCKGVCFHIVLAINFRAGDMLFVIDERLYTALSHMNTISQCPYSLESSDEWVSYGLAGFNFGLPVFASRS